MRRTGARLPTGTVATVSPWQPVNRRASVSRLPGGIMALSLAAMLMLVMPAVLGSGVPGAALPEALPPPPEVGSCVLLPQTMADGGPSDDQVSVVPCSEPHDAEITMNWPAFVYPKANGGDLPDTGTFNVTGQARGFTFFQCQGWNNQYIGSAATGGFLTSKPVFTGGLVYGSPDQRYNRLHWSACAVMPALTLARYTGSIRSAGSQSSAARPDAYMSCLALGDFGATELAYRTCADPHRVEPIGLDPDPSASLPDDQVMQQCRELVSTVTGAVDPTFGGRLDIEVQTLELRVLSGSEYPTSDRVGAQDCMVELVGDGSLVGTVIGLGDGPLRVVP